MFSSEHPDADLINPGQIMCQNHHDCYQDLDQYPLDSSENMFLQQSLQAVDELHREIFLEAEEGRFAMG